MPLTLSLQLSADAPRGAAIGVGVLSTSKGPQLPAGMTLSAAVLKGRGFDAKLGQTLAVPSRGGTQILVGLGDASALTIDSFRTAAAALARASYNETIGPTLPKRLPKASCSPRTRSRRTNRSRLHVRLRTL
jgi:Cytosol aminopeptidase family, N-terminal domain